MKPQIIKPFLKTNILCDLDTIICIAKHLNKEHNMSFNISEFIMTYTDLVKEYDNYKNNVFDIISKYFGKYIRIKTFCKNSDTICHHYVMCPYRYNPSNDCLFGLICDINDEFKGGIQDSHINPLYLLEQNETIEINDITEDEFLQIAKVSFFNCYRARINKLESDDYVLTKNGYEYKPDNNLKDEILPF